MHSSNAACVFGEARLISSTSSRFVKTGPGRNSNSFERWLKTLTPVTSDGSRSGVNCSREKEQSIERASAFASVVFPTPGRSSMIRWPSASRQRTVSCSVSSGAWTTPPRFATMRRIASSDPILAAALRSGSSINASSSNAVLLKGSLLRHQLHDLVEDLTCDSLLRRLPDSPLSHRRDQHDLVLGRVETDVVPRDVVEDDQIGSLRGQLLARAGEAGVAVVGGEADQQLPVTPPCAELREHVARRLERHRPRRGVLRPLAGALLFE